MFKYDSKGFSPPQARKKIDPFIRYFGTGSCRGGGGGGSGEKIILKASITAKNNPLSPML